VTADPRAQEDPEVVVRDKRRLDPQTGEVRPVDAVAPEAGPAAEATDPVAELTADLQRLSAEYANYRKRVERDRVAVVEMATAGLLNGLLPLLDDVERARSHGDLTGAFAAVGEGLEQFTAKLGLERFGTPGEPFDPSVHEAVMAAEPDPSATVQVCAMVFQPGFRLSGGRVLRPARVSVAEPAAPAPVDSPAGSPDPAES
jgi:molecular chaperone GrpE